MVFRYIHRHTCLTRTYSGVIVSCKDTAGELNCDGYVCVCRRCDICVCVCAVFCVHKVGEIDKYCEFQLRMHRATINMCVLERTGEVPTQFASKEGG